ncbi:2-oxoglutarate (2OG) and Fe(II)-dependent oxygenase superfamily [Raphidocelis subcapitata]|uniref:2-oxoglutarate (2OG) and Fe(II)-dependent oxygenase superfamily n=1 Tax=Raphidocelis subcapitata TaxID=307507 RepID=A0A2V0P8E6_9CHLO|nr:2-oxoglutarate (2OG) and Fe(II)-dependent oxygenase superfamily [Raphidocelis subcapitata]|eukprot:GBF95212.1 2-oxoglutarate (2OG) and Fe(II)-dependent oxygenase superfamily [Raphidocelis subcapitata]
MAPGDPLPSFDLVPLVGLDLSDGVKSDAVRELCTGIADCLHETGCLIVRVPGVDEADNDAFLDLVESYFGQSDEAKMQDTRPQFSYQVGATPSGVETPRCLVDPDCQRTMADLPAGHKAAPVTGADVKWRYFWRVGPRPSDGKYKELNAEPVVPQGFPQWAAVMDSWGGKMLGAVQLVATAAAVGFGLEPDAITKLMAFGPHLLAPTGSDLAKHGALGTVLAGFHYDLNLLTIHGRSRFPGLHVWLRDGRRVPVRVPAGCLLLQAGRQLEWLTGGHVKAGWHEVVVTEATSEAAARASEAGRSLWRVSSTVFAHVASAQVLRPLGRFGGAGAAAAAYPPTEAGVQVQQELEAISLRKGGGGGGGGE